MEKNFNFALKSLGESEVNEYFREIEYNFPKEYISIFYFGNKFNTKEWYFFPIKDSKNIKKTVLDIVEINKRINDDEFYIIADNRGSAYLAFSKKDDDDSVYIIDTEENSVSFLTNDFKEFLVRLNQRFPEKEIQEKLIKDIKKKLKDSDSVYYIDDPENDFTVFVQSMEYYPSAVGLFWLDEEKIKKVRNEKFPDFSIKKIKVSEFKMVYLSILDDEQHLLGLDWGIDDDGLEIFPDSLM